MKRKKFLVILLVLCILCITGCTSKKENNKVLNSKKEDINQVDAEVAKGRYMEIPCETITEANNISELQLYGEKSLSAIDSTTGNLFLSNDLGDKWTKEEIKPMLKILNMEDAEITSCTYNENFGIFFSYIIWSEIKSEGKTIPEHYVYIEKNGTARNLDIIINNQRSWLQNSVFGQDGNLYALTVDAKLVKIIPVEERVEVLIDKGVFTGTIALNKEYVVVLGENSGYVYNIKSKEIKETKDVFNEFLKSKYNKNETVHITMNNRDTAIFIACKSGVYRYEINGNVMEQLVTGEMTNLGDPAYEVTAFQMMEDVNFIIGYNNGEINKYIYDKDMPTVPTKQMVVYGLYDNSTIRRAISDYRKIYPDVFIKFEVGVSGSGSVNEKDAIKSLNTKILAGDGPDLILLDGLPVNSFIEKEVLLDLSDIISEMEQSGDYFSGIIKALQSEQGTYGIPIKFQIPIIAGKKNLISGCNSLEGISKLIKESDQKKYPQLGCYNAKELQEHLAAGCSSAWFAKDGQLDTNKLKEYFKAAADIVEKDINNLSEQTIKRHESELNDRNETESERKERQLKLAYNIISYMFGEQEIIIGNMREIQDYQLLNSAMKSDSSFGYQKLELQSKNNYIPSGILAINASSRNKETAKNFYKTVFSESVQKENLADGLPVSKKVFLKLNKGNLNNSSYSLSNSEGVSIEYTINVPTDVQMNEFMKLADSLDTPYLLDREIGDILNTAGENMLNKSVDFEEGMNILTQKIEFYLSE